MLTLPLYDSSFTSCVRKNRVSTNILYTAIYLWSLSSTGQRRHNCGGYRFKSGRESVARMYHKASSTDRFILSLSKVTDTSNNMKYVMPRSGFAQSSIEHQYGLKLALTVRRHVSYGGLLHSIERELEAIYYYVFNSYYHIRLLQKVAIIYLSVGLLTVV